MIPTPAAVLDLDAFERNLAKMAGRAEAAGLALRPHSKSHKASEIARRQLEAGAVGICCAKLAEAEAMAAAGIGAILVTSPIAGEANAARAARLAAELPDFRIVIDHEDGVAELAAAATTPVQVLIDVDVGLGRTGVASPEQAAGVARAILAAPQLKLLGLQGYGGNWQHMEGANARAVAVAEGKKKLRAAADSVRAAGGRVTLLTGGGTGTFAADAAQGVLTEVQPGSYAFMDRQYRDALKADPDGAFETSLVVAATVISANHPQWVTLDAGLKAFATDAAFPQPVTAGFEACQYRWFGDEHGLLMRPPGRKIGRGARVELVVPHIDPTLDKYDVIHACRGDVLEAVWAVEARGASQ
jgi:D-serine deaminase-like pyridoxal phosphate-dependent protein